MKSNKSEKVKVIVSHCLQQTSPLIAGQLTLRNARTLTQTDNRTIADSSETDERENDEYDSDAIDSGGDDSIAHFSFQAGLLNSRPSFFL